MAWGAASMNICWHRIFSDVALLSADIRAALLLMSSHRVGIPANQTRESKVRELSGRTLVAFSTGFPGQRGSRTRFRSPKAFFGLVCRNDA